MADIELGSVERIFKIALEIKEAVKTAQRNEEECENVRLEVEKLMPILSQSRLEVMEATNQQPGMNGALMGVEKSLDRALKLVKVCQERHTIPRFLRHPLRAGDRPVHKLKGFFRQKYCSNAYCQPQTTKSPLDDDDKQPVVHFQASSVSELDLEAGHLGQHPEVEILEVPPEVEILKVREQLRRADDECLFAPQTVLIGPYHQREEGFFWSTEEKKKAVRDLENLRVDPVDLKQLLMQDGLGLQVRRCYTRLPHDQYMDPEAAFTEMLLHDGCYLLSFFIEFEQKRGTLDNREGGGGQLSCRRLIGRDSTVVRDILYLLENQIPLFALDRMLHHIVGNGEATSALGYIAKPVEKLLQKQLYISNTPRLLPPESTTSDLLHIVYSYFRHPPSQAERRPRAAQGRRSLTGRWRQATEYSRYADLRFRRRVFETGDSWTILDIALQRGTLRIPRLRVDSNTWTMLRNLMALEEREERRPVTAYCCFMSQVACTAEDVVLLQRAKILEHFLGSDEQAAKGFAKLCDGVDLDIDNLEQNYLKPIWHRLEARCRMPVYSIKGFFRQKYCGNAFYRLVFFAALFLYASQVLQAIYAVIAYHRPPKNP